MAAAAMSYHASKSARAAIRSGDEVESLADSFNLMTSTLFQRDRILEGVRLAAQDFLFAEDWEPVIGAVLARLGQSTLAARTDLFLLAQDPDGRFRLDHRCCWVADEPDAPVPGTGTTSLDEGGLRDLLGEAPRSGVIAGPCAELPREVRRLLEPLGIQSLVLAPVLVEGTWWGLLLLSDRSRGRAWTDAEKDSLKALADMMGATVARHRTQAELLEAKGTLERRVHERTAELQEQMAAKEKAHRELAEETGLRGVLTPMGFTHSFWMDPSILGFPPGPPRFNTETCFHMEVEPAAQVDLALDEHSEYRWCSIPEAHDLMLWEGSKTALLRLQRSLALNLSVSGGSLD